MSASTQGAGRLKGKAAIVTGAARGIGRATCDVTGGHDANSAA